MSSGQRDVSGWGEEEVAALTVAAMSSRGRWAADNATRSDGRLAGNVTRVGSNNDGKQQDPAVNIAMKEGGR